ncbi:hypothetical protein GOBAR_AA23194 [Gossypium barbadense]|uniref:RRM domain-containing protein n=1 Tax=Gossypium barbadense TaxID=3634 RepID=A0A2P5X2B8_GOSBA|nr:hypothetical protein GOBAR_AA23194 [Gossypium barbadense]
MEDLKKRKMEEMGNNDQLSTQEELRSLLDPLAKSQLVDLLSRLRDMSETYSICPTNSVTPSLYALEESTLITSEVILILESSKICVFMCMLTHKEGPNILRLLKKLKAFRMHGEIEEGAVIYDKATGKSRGYGFVTYKHMESAHSALGAPSKLIDFTFLFLICGVSKIRVAMMVMASGVNISSVKLNTEREKRRRKTHSGSISDNQKMTLRGGPPAVMGRMAVCNLACEGLTGASTTPDLAQRKLYIGGLSPDVTSEMLLNYFGRHGEIEEGSVAYDKDTNESRGFGFVTYKTIEAAKKAIDDPQKILGGRTIIVKLADTHKGKPVQTQVPAAAVVPLAMPMAPGYPQLGKAHPSATPAGYAYTQPVAPYQASSYSSPAAAPAPYPSQSTIPYASIAAKKDPQGIPPTTPMGMSGYPYYIGK